MAIPAPLLWLEPAFYFPQPATPTQKTQSYNTIEKLPTQPSLQASACFVTPTNLIFPQLPFPD